MSVSDLSRLISSAFSRDKLPVSVLTPPAVPSGLTELVCIYGKARV